MSPRKSRDGWSFLKVPMNILGIKLLWLACTVYSEFTAPIRSRFALEAFRDPNAVGTELFLSHPFGRLYTHIYLSYSRSPSRLSSVSPRVLRAINSLDKSNCGSAGVVGAPSGRAKRWNSEWWKGVSWATRISKCSRFNPLIVRRTASATAEAHPRITHVRTAGETRMHNGEARQTMSPIQCERRETMWRDWTLEYSQRTIVTVLTADQERERDRDQPDRRLYSGWEKRRK